mmetsp:Transcript_11201/g.21084  ORF Transcript_11201/g.21084 Transcript_11201/m.21084 type:complete len:85 (+) Transcript_11201:1568-1822(+)
MMIFRMVATAVGVCIFWSIEEIVMFHTIVIRMRDFMDHVVPRDFKGECKDDKDDQQHRLHKVVLILVYVPGLTVASECIQWEQG